MFHEVLSIIWSFILPLNENIAQSTSSRMRNKKMKAKIELIIISLIASMKVLISKIRLS